MTTPTPHPDTLEILASRGFVKDVTDREALAKQLSSERTTFYVGFDPTASSLHIGNLVGIMAMAWLQKLGHRPLALAGGSTGRIGDPSGRDAERELLDEAAIESNLASIRGQLSQILDLSSDDRGMLVDNYDWTKGVTVLEFLRDVGKHFSVNQMIAKESVRARLEEREQGISFTEFSYQLLQAFDFERLYDLHGCRLQGGGSDQWGNIVGGVDLVRRMHGAEVHGLTWPLLTRSDGKKFGKSSGAPVWLSPDLTSPFAYYQYFLNVADDDVEKFLNILTFVEGDEIAEIVAEHAKDPAKRFGQRTLAEHVTRILHGDAGVARAENATKVLFSKDPLSGLTDEALGDAFDGATTVERPRADLDGGVAVVDLLVESGAAASNGEVRRLIKQGGVRVNNVTVADDTQTLTAADLASETAAVLRIGKKNYVLARFT